MSDWQGYLIKNVTTNKEFDLHLIQFDSYKSTPNQREEIKAYRDENSRDLYRVTASGTKSKIEFTTMPHLTFAKKKKIQNFFRSGLSSDDWHQRKVHLSFWNDEDNEYYTAYFYIPDISFSIEKIEKDGPVYQALDIHLVEY